MELIIDSIKNHNKIASIEVVNGILITIEDSFNFLSKFRKKIWLTKLIFRQNIEDDFLELNARITGHISDLNLSETIYGQELQIQLEEDINSNYYKKLHKKFHQLESLESNEIEKYLIKKIRNIINDKNYT